jgi:hypothetical protein
MKEKKYKLRIFGHKPAYGVGDIVETKRDLVVNDGKDTWDVRKGSVACVINFVYKDHRPLYRLMIEKNDEKGYITRWANHSDIDIFLES